MHATKILSCTTLLFIFATVPSETKSISQEIRAVITIGQEVTDFVQQRLMPTVNKVDSELKNGNSNAMQILTNLFVLLESAGESVARASDSYVTNVLENQGNLKDAYLASQIGCGIKFAGHGFSAMMKALEGYTDSNPDDTTDVSFKMLTDLLELIKELLDYQTNQLCYDNDNSFFNLVDF